MAFRTARKQLVDTVHQPEYTAAVEQTLTRSWPLAVTNCTAWHVYVWCRMLGRHKLLRLVS